MIMLLVVLGKDNHAFALAQLFYAGPKGKNSPRIVVYGYGLGIVKNTHRNGGNYVGQKFKKPVGVFGLL